MASDGFELNWYPERALAIIERGMGQNLDAAAIYCTNVIKESFGDSSDRETETQARERDARGRFKAATKAERARNRSKPWGPPHVDTGHLRRNVAWARDRQRKYIRYVGTGIGNAESVGYALYLEYGTEHMLPRPFLRPGIYKSRPVVRKLLTRKLI